MSVRLKNCLSFGICRFTFMKRSSRTSRESGLSACQARCEKGLVAKLSPLFPRHTIRIPSVQALPSDGTVPFLEEWRWVHTPGHTPGHISLFRDKDRVLLAGDAVITVEQESLADVVIQSKSFTVRPPILQRIRRRRPHPFRNWRNWSRKRF